MGSDQAKGSLGPPQIPHLPGAMKYIGSELLAAMKASWWRGDHWSWAGEPLSWTPRQPSAPGAQTRSSQHGQEGVSRIPVTSLSRVLSKLPSFPLLREQHSYPCAHTSVNQPGWAQRPPSKGQERHNEEITSSPQPSDPPPAHDQAIPSKQGCCRHRQVG